jgi:hypothetical protein
VAIILENTSPVKGAPVGCAGFVGDDAEQPRPKARAVSAHLTTPRHTLEFPGNPARVRRCNAQQRGWSPAVEIGGHPA